MKSPHKYSAQVVYVAGIRFPSKREANRWAELQLLERAGEIAQLRRQVPIAMEGQTGPILTPTGRKAKYVADFSYVDTKSGAWVIEDAKGFQTEAYKLKRAILAAMGVHIREV